MDFKPALRLWVCCFSSHPSGLPAARLQGGWWRRSGIWAGTGQTDHGGGGHPLPLCEVWHGHRETPTGAGDLFTSEDTAGAASANADDVCVSRWRRASLWRRSGSWRSRRAESWLRSSDTKLFLHYAVVKHFIYLRETAGLSIAPFIHHAGMKLTK